MDLKRIGENISERRGQLKLRQEDLSEMSGLTVRSIYNIEQGIGNPSFETLSKICSVLGMEIILQIRNRLMQKGTVYNNGEIAGDIEKADGKYIFRYEESYFSNPGKQAISLTFPKEKQEYTSDVLFPFFYGLLSEGVNKDLQCRLLKIDEADDFTRLLKTTGEDTIGAITVKEE